MKRIVATIFGLMNMPIAAAAREPENIRKHCNVSGPRCGNRRLVEGNGFLGRGRPGRGGARILGQDQPLINNYFARLAGRDCESAPPGGDGISDSPLNIYFQVRPTLVARTRLAPCAPGEGEFEIFTHAFGSDPVVPPGAPAVFHSVQVGAGVSISHHPPVLVERKKELVKCTAYGLITIKS